MFGLNLYEIRIRIVQICPNCIYIYSFSYVRFFIQISYTNFVHFSYIRFSYTNFRQRQCLLSSAVYQALPHYKLSLSLAFHPALLYTVLRGSPNSSAICPPLIPSLAIFHIFSLSTLQAFPPLAPAAIFFS